MTADAKVTYFTALKDVDWARLKQDLAADAFDNGRTADQLQRSFGNSFACVFARCDDHVIGTAVWRYWPINRFGPIRFPLQVAAEPDQAAAVVSGS